MAGETLLALLDKAAPTTGTERPKNAFDCALKDFGCTGWTVPQFAIIKAPNGQLIGLCPRREQHATIAKNDAQARLIVARLASLFRATNPNYEVGSKVKTKAVTVTA